MTGFWVSYISGALCNCCALWFNVSNHPPDQPADALGCRSSDHGPSRRPIKSPSFFFTGIMHYTTYLGVTLLIGEGTHRHHHDHAALAHRPGGIDLPYYLFVLPLEALGLVWNVNHLHKHAC